MKLELDQSGLLRTATLGIIPAESKEAGTQKNTVKFVIEKVRNTLV